jgi:hypothetical protein
VGVREDAGTVCQIMKLHHVSVFGSVYSGLFRVMYIAVQVTLQINNLMSRN